MITLGGTVCIRNGERFDYCWRECIQSLLPVCDQVVVCEGQSSDGTWKEVLEWAEREPKIKPCIYNWPDPKADGDFFVKWLNFARESLDTDFNFEMDADEVLSESSYGEVMTFKSNNNSQSRVSLWCLRHNFFGDAQSLIPHGHCLGHKVVRVGPSSVWMPSDGSHPKGDDIVNMASPSGIEIFHYGFLRKKPAYFAKSRDLHTFFFGALTDKRLLDVEHSDGNWMKKMKGVEWIDKLVPFSGTHPKLAIPWLKERGYSV